MLKNTINISSVPKYFLDNPTTLNKFLYEKFPTYKFDKSQNKWSDLSNEPSDIIKNKTLSFISYNVWFENVNWSNRLKALFNIFQEYSPDFISLQEVTQEFLVELLKQNFVRENYYFSGNFKGSYDVFMLSKYNTKYYTKTFKSNMGRNLLFTEINYVSENGNYKNFITGTSHFESLNSAKQRKNQLENSFDLLGLSDNSFLMGDFNFDSTWKQEEININKDYLDCWFMSKDKCGLNDEDRYTMPKSERFPAWRPDRIIYRNSGMFELEFFEILGKEKIEQDINEGGNVLTPSDHYGLFAMFNIKD